MSTKSRFDAERLERLATNNHDGTFEMQFSNDKGERHIVSLPVPAAVAFARLICDVSEKTPFLLGPRVVRSRRA